MRTEEEFRDFTQTRVDFLLADLDLAMTFLDVAKTSMLERTKRRNYHNARAAYDTVMHLLEALEPNLEQNQAIDAKLGRLKIRLMAVGQQS